MIIKDKIKFFIIFLIQICLKRFNRIYYCHGSMKRLHLGKRVSLVNTLFNVSSGEIYIGDDTIFGHNCMVLTGVHQFEGGIRKKLFSGAAEAPVDGHNIKIGKGCWIASGVIISGNVNIGDNVIIGAGSVVTRDIPSGVFVAGVPARIIRTHNKI